MSPPSVPATQAIRRDQLATIVRRTSFLNRPSQSRSLQGTRTLRLIDNVGTDQCDRAVAPESDNDHRLFSSFSGIGIDGPCFDSWDQLPTELDRVIQRVKATDQERIHTKSIVF
jgi:hypothetical protein